MENVYCSESALKLWRMPPGYFLCLEGVRSEMEVADHQLLVDDATAKAVYGSPFHTLIFDMHDHTAAKKIKQHYWEGALPEGAIREISEVGYLTSPAFTLYLLSRTMNAGQIAMLMYEFCGGYTTYTVPQRIKELARSEPYVSHVNDYKEWRMVKDASGFATELWMRPAICTIRELQDLLPEVVDRRGGKTYKRALEMVFGHVLSPLEAKAAVLLGAPRRRGGWGLDLVTDERIEFDKYALALTSRGYANADIMIANTTGTHVVDIECQGAVAHTGESASIADAQRSGAVQSVGIDVLPLTYGQLRSEEAMEAFVRLVCKKLDFKFQPKSDLMKKASEKLRTEIF